MRTIATLYAALALLSAPVASAQDLIVYRLGKDTVAIEQFTRTATRFSGEMVTRAGASVQRIQYDITLGSDGRPTAANVRRRQPDGTPFANAPAEWRFAFRADSATRTTVWADSSQARTFAAPRAFMSLPVFVYAPMEIVYGFTRGGGSRDSVPALGLAGNNVAATGLQTVGGDTLRLRGGPYAMLMRFDRDGKLLSVDGSQTTNKMVGTRTQGRIDIAAIAAGMKPTGVLSPRATAYASFAQGPVFINYGSPAVRERTVWGGTLIPFDDVWRVGANEAAHLATSKTIAFGDLTLAPGLYTLWIQHTRTGTSLIVNKQVGQWGTAYQAAQDVGRVAMETTPTEHVEDFLITIRALGGGRGAIDFAWGSTKATATFALRQ